MEADYFPLPDPGPTPGGSSVVIGEALPFSLEEALDVLAMVDSTKVFVVPIPEDTVRPETGERSVPNGIQANDISIDGSSTSRPSQRPNG